MMTTTPSPATPARPATRTASDDLKTVPDALRSELIKLSSLRVNTLILALTGATGLVTSWAVAAFVTDEVLTVANVFVYPALLIAVLASVTGIMLFTSEAQHGTLATALTARPARWVLAASKTIMAIARGLVLGAFGMATGAIGAVLGGLPIGDTKAMTTTALWALLFTALTALTAVIGLGIGMTVRHGAGAISGLLVWWFIAENLIRAFAPAKASRFLPFDAGYRLLGVGSDFDTPDILAVALTKAQCALVFGAYAAAALAIGTTLLHRRDTN